VALDDSGQPREVPALLAETEAERERMARGRERQSQRLASS